MAGDSLLHVVAACGDDEKFLDCAKLLFSHYKDLLSARNSKGDTPLHCAAAAGNKNMVKCLVLLASGSETLEVKKLLKMPNECGETALHHAVRARRKDVVDQLIPCNEVSPLYLTVSLGEMEIARRLFIATSRINKGKPSTYSGPHGRNVLHAAAMKASTILILKLSIYYKILYVHKTVNAPTSILKPCFPKRKKIE
jgi:ankyrin repeat protein